MANCKRLLVNCLFLAAFLVLFMHHAYSIGMISKAHAAGDNERRKGFRETQNLDSVWKSLAMHNNAAADIDKGPVLVVSKDTSNGNYTTVQSAIDAVPQNNNKVAYIYIQPGIYREKVNIPINKPFIVMLGSNANNTIITWNDHAGVNGETYLTPTVSVDASDFIAENITFENSYGPGDQAVALRVSGDRSAFYGCKFLGYQDTLFDDKGRHYFKDCFIEGGADFICGDGQSVYETCHLHAIPQVSGAITAQKRSSSSEGTGYAFISCCVTGSGLSFLGRAWGAFSRVVFSRSYFDDVILPEGWHNWGDSTRNKTTFYGEYQCYGPGANRSGRVPWSYNLTDAEAMPFLNISFIDGEKWLTKFPIF